jgi:serine/threonine-protein kinase
VTLQVSRGPAQVIVPDLSGMSRSEAEAELRRVGLVPATSGFSALGDQVVSQNPRAGTQVPSGSTVHLTIF